MGQSVKSALWAIIETQREACKNAYIAGNPWDETERLALLRAEEIVTDWFTSRASDFALTMHGLGKITLSEEDVLKLMEDANAEHERDTPL